MILISLLKMLSNPTEFFRKELLVFLKAIISYIDFKKEEFIGLGADLISPLLRLLLTDFAEPALEVLDETDVISGSIMDRDILRMSLGNTTVKRSMKIRQPCLVFPKKVDGLYRCPLSLRLALVIMFTRCFQLVLQQQLLLMNKRITRRFNSIWRITIALVYMIMGMQYQSASMKPL